jgi:uncharacterized protein YsxB (DUF464 family)
LIKIIIEREKKDIKRVVVSGHGGEKRGEDIICAGVSAVAQTALSGLLHYGKDHVRWKSRDGFLEISIAGFDEPQRRTIFSAILTTMMLGLKGIEREHPKKVRVSVEDG